MLHLSAAVLMLFGMGFVRVVFSIAAIQAHPGQSVTIWCTHNIHVTGNLYWFKQTDGDVPIAIVHMLFTESLQNVSPKYFNNFTKDHMVMDQFSKNTSLTINEVKMSDSGFYFCGAPGYHMNFGNGSRLEVKDLSWPTVFISEKNCTETSQKDHEESSTSTEECSGGIYYNLTFVFGGIIFSIFPLILVIIREHRRQKHKKAVAECQAQQQSDKKKDSVEYAAVYFSNKRLKAAGQRTKDPIVVYTNTT